MQSSRSSATGPRWLRRAAVLGAVLGGLVAPAGALVVVAGGAPARRAAPLTPIAAGGEARVLRRAAAGRPLVRRAAEGGSAGGGLRAMRLSGGDGGGKEGAREPAAATLRERVELLALIALWYAASVVCTNTTKSIGAHWSVLTFSQLVLSTVCGAFVVCVLGYPQRFQPIASGDQLRKTALLASVFTMGFVTLNWALGMMHVSLVMTLRATEPMFTLLLASVLLRAEPVTWRMGAALLPVIAGAALSSAESADVSFMGLAVVFLCNVFFALRGIVTKRIKAVYPVDEFNLFLQEGIIKSHLYGGVI